MSHQPVRSLQSAAAPYAGLAALSNLRSLKLVAPCAPSRTVAAGLEEALAGLTALRELSLALHSTMFTVRTAPAVRPVDGVL